LAATSTETSKGDLPLALALGIVLLVVGGLINGAIGVAHRAQGKAMDFAR